MAPSKTQRHRQQMTYVNGDSSAKGFSVSWNCLQPLGLSALKCVPTSSIPSPQIQHHSVLHRGHVMWLQPLILSVSIPHPGQGFVSVSSARAYCSSSSNRLLYASHDCPACAL